MVAVGEEVHAKGAKGREEREGHGMQVEQIVAVAVDCGLKIHQQVGSGLLESAYEAILARALEKRGLVIERQKLIPIHFDDLIIDNGFRADILINGEVLIELKSIDRLAPVHSKQVLTYLRFLNLPIGLLMNFGGETFKDGLRRIVNNHTAINGSPLRVNQQPPQS